MKLTLNDKYKRRKLKIRETISGSLSKPRLTVFRSNSYIYGQAINDVLGNTIASVSSKDFTKLAKVPSSFEAGKLIAKLLSDKGITEVVFDRNGYKYHGRIKSFADGAREGGLKF
jgi:large subunit ribosomal protein L18